MSRGWGAVRAGWAWLAKARDWSADRRSQAIAAAAAVLLLIAMIALLVGKATTSYPAGPPHVGGGSEGLVQVTMPAIRSDAPRAAEPVVPATSRSTSPAPSAPAATTAGAGSLLSAEYKTEDLKLTSYRVTISIRNPGTDPIAGWAVVTVLPLLDLTVRNVTGAVMSRTDPRVIFTPIDSTRTVPAGGSATVTFEVEGLGVRNGPFTCTIDGRPCTAVRG
jgi:hypothetical protein